MNFKKTLENCKLKQSIDLRFFLILAALLADDLVNTETASQYP